MTQYDDFIQKLLRDARLQSLPGTSGGEGRIRHHLREASSEQLIALLGYLQNSSQQDSSSQEMFEGDEFTSYDDLVAQDDEDPSPEAQYLYRQLAQTGRRFEPAVTEKLLEAPTETLEKLVWHANFPPEQIRDLLEQSSQNLTAQQAGKRYQARALVEIIVRGGWPLTEQTRQQILKSLENFEGVESWAIKVLAHDPNTPRETLWQAYKALGGATDTQNWLRLACHPRAGPRLLNRAIWQLSGGLEDPILQVLTAHDFDLPDDPLECLVHEGTAHQLRKTFMKGPRDQRAYVLGGLIDRFPKEGLALLEEQKEKEEDWVEVTPELLEPLLTSSSENLRKRALRLSDQTPGRSR